MPRCLIHLTVLLAVLLGLAGPALARGGPWEERPHSLQSAHPYPADANDETEIAAPGASAVRVHFTRIATEEGFDWIEVLDSDGEVVERYTGEHEDVWTPPVRGGRVRLRFTSDASIEGYGFTVDRIALRGSTEVVSDLAALRIDLPRGGTMSAGRSAPLVVVGLGPSGDARPLDGHPIYFNVSGPVRVLAVDLPDAYKVVAEEGLLATTEAVITAYSGRSPRISGTARIVVRPRRPLAGLVLRCEREKLPAGGTEEVTIVGKPLSGRGGPQAIPPGELVVRLAGPGTLVPARRGGAASYRLTAPDSVRRGKSAVVTAYLRDEPEIAGKLSVHYERRVLTRPAAIRDADDLIRITGWSTRGDWQDPWNRHRLPGPGEDFVARSQNHRFAFRVNRRHAPQIEVEVYEAGDPADAERYTEDQDSLKVTENDSAVEGVFRDQLREGKGEYVVAFYVWTGPRTVERQTFRVVRERRGK